MSLDLARMRRLLDSGLELSSETTLDRLLQRAVELAADLTGARYAALGVLGDEGLADFITTGVSPAERAAIGALPRGRGILGALISDAQPLRLHDLGADSRSSGFPPNHPPMRTFLGAPIRAHARVFGNFYLAEKVGGGDFTQEDEETLILLGAQAGSAIASAHLYAESQFRDRSLAALREAGAAIRGGDDPHVVLELVARRARELCGAHLATIVLPAANGTELIIDVADGERAAELVGVVVPVDRSLSGRALREGRTLRLADASDEEDAFGPLVQVGGFGAAIFVPLSSQGPAFGVLSVSRPPGATPFRESDVLLIESFAGQAAIALEYGHAMRELQRLALAEDRDRIARELHDGVIQALFATGLNLQSTAGLIVDPVCAHRVRHAVGEIDTVITDLRSYIFGLRPGALARNDLTGALDSLCSEVQQRTGVVTVVHVDPAAARMAGAIEADVLQVAREALSNMGRHARAVTCRVSLQRVDGGVLLEVDDDGAGFDTGVAPAGMGLANLRERAAGIGGSLEIVSVAGEGTTVRLSVPVAPSRTGRRTG